MNKSEFGKIRFILFWSNDEKLESIVRPVTGLFEFCPFVENFALVNCVRDPVTGKYPKAKKRFNVSRIPTIVDLSRGSARYFEGTPECVSLLNRLIDSTKKHEIQQEIRDSEGVFSAIIDSDLDLVEFESGQYFNNNQKYGPLTEEQKVYEPQSIKLPDKADMIREAEEDAKKIQQLKMEKNKSVNNRVVYDKK